MNDKDTTIKYKRISVVLSNRTIKLLDSVVEKRERSSFIDKAIIAKLNLNKELREGATRRAERDLSIAEDSSDIFDFVRQRKYLFDI